MLSTLLRTGVVSGVAVGSLLAAPPAGAADRPRWQERPTGVDAGFRGLDAVSHDVAWVAGSGGTVLRTTNGGRTWRHVAPRLAGTLEFRDVEAFGARRAVILSIGPGSDSRIYRTTDGGAHWRQTFVNRNKTAFYDCMTFLDRKHGLALSDPVDGKFRILGTNDGGRSWRVHRRAGMPKALDGEFAFAASGTCITSVRGTRQAWFATGGGARSRVFHSIDDGRTWKDRPTTIPSGPTAGVYSLAFKTVTRGLAVGGVYTTPYSAPRSLARTHDGGRTWSGRGRRVPNDYRSGSAWIPGERGTAVVVGPTGSDISTDGGYIWTRFDRGSFDAVDCAPDGTCWASGQAGRVGRLLR